MVSNSLEEINEIRSEIKRLSEEREINIIEAQKSINYIKEKYQNILKNEGERYCIENCPEIPDKIKEIKKELSGFL